MYYLFLVLFSAFVTFAIIISANLQDREQYERVQREADMRFEKSMDSVRSLVGSENPEWRTVYDKEKGRVIKYIRIINPDTGTGRITYEEKNSNE